MKSIKKPIVIVGAGFAGMAVALNLKSLNPSLPVLVVDAESRFLFKPLMYEVLSKEITMWECAPEFSKIFSDAGITFLRNYLTKIYFNNSTRYLPCRRIIRIKEDFFSCRNILCKCSTA